MPEILQALALWVIRIFYTEDNSMESDFQWFSLNPEICCAHWHI
jgi:hypothetical protein